MQITDLPKYELKSEEVSKIDKILKDLIKGEEIEEEPTLSFEEEKDVVEETFDMIGLTLTERKAVRDAFLINEMTTGSMGGSMGGYSVIPNTRKVAINSSPNRRRKISEIDGNFGGNLQDKSKKEIEVYAPKRNKR